MGFNRWPPDLTIEAANEMYAFIGSMETYCFIISTTEYLGKPGGRVSALLLKPCES